MEKKVILKVLVAKRRLHESRDAVELDRPHAYCGQFTCHHRRHDPSPSVRDLLHLNRRTVDLGRPDACEDGQKDARAFDPTPG